MNSFEKYFTVIIGNIGGVVYSHRQISIQEAVLILSDHYMKPSSRSIMFIDTHDQNLRVHISKPTHDQHNLVSGQDNLFLTYMFLHYQNRPYSLEAISVYQFVINYTYFAKHSKKKALPLLNDDGFITQKN